MKYKSERGGVGKASQKGPMVGFGRIKMRESRGDFRLARFCSCNFIKTELVLLGLLLVWTTSQG